MAIFLGTLLEPLSLLIYLIAILLQYRHERLKKQVVLIFYYVIAAALMIFANWLLYLPGTGETIDNGPFYNLMFFLTAVFLFVFFNQIIHTQIKRFLNLLFFIVVALFVATYIMGRQQSLNSFTAAISFFFVSCCSFSYFYQSVKNIRHQDILQRYDFWLCSAFLVYFLSNFFIVLAWSYLANAYKTPLTYEQAYQFTILWAVHNILLFVSSMVVLISTIWINYRRQSLS